MTEETKQPTDRLKVLCIYCNAPWDAFMEHQLDHISGGCHTCGHGAHAEITFRITCSNCNRVVYIKEGIDLREY